MTVYTPRLVHHPGDVRRKHVVTVVTRVLRLKSETSLGFLFFFYARVFGVFQTAVK